MKINTSQQLNALLARGLEGTALERYQLERLVEICGHAAQYVPFYQGRSALMRDPQSNFRKSFASIPILTRDEVAKNSDALRATIEVPQAGPTRAVTTSGTVGQPLLFHVNKLSDVFSQLAYRRYFRSWDISNPVKVLTVRTPKTAADRQSGETKETSLPGGGGVEYTSFVLEPERVCQLIDTYRPDYLRTFPSVAYEAAVFAEKRGLQRKLKLVMTVGETVHRELASVIKRAFGCDLADAYATEELQLVAYSCKQCGSYHCTNDNLFIELLDHRSQPVAVGSEGRVVVTTLNNFSMPLIRYELDDIAVRGASKGPCSKRGLALTRILGRKRNMFELKDGRRMWPNINTQELHVRGIKQFQVIQVDTENIEFRYNTVTGRSLPEDDLVMLTRSFIDESVRVAVFYDDKLRAAGSGKLMPYVSRLAT